MRQQETTVTKLKRFLEIIDYGRKTNRVAYVMQTSALPSPLAGAEWREDISFNEADELLREPKLKAVFKLAVDSGCQVVTES